MEKQKFGVCRLSLVPVRSETSDKAEQVTQLLFGDHYEVIEESANKKWIKIRIHFDQYEGWIDRLQFHEVSLEYYEYISRADFKITTDLTSSMLYNKSPLLILMGSIIPISSSELFKMEDQFAFNGEAKTLGQKREFDFIKNIALKYLNAPYLWGGKSPFGIDCSGFTQMVFKIVGYQLLRDASQQANQGKSVEAIIESKPGDLVFFKNAERKIHHVGIALSDNKIIHASGRVRIDSLDQEGIINTDTKIHSHNFSHIRRIIPES
jgi:gamma-D-glutamyl-L-lysine dipeptidyl-peptidase